MTDEANAGGAAHDASVESRGLGLLLPADHPRSAEAYADPRNWPMELLLAGQPFAAPPASYTTSSVRPNALDQDGSPACVAFSGVLIKDTQEKVDQGGWYYDTPSAYLAYNRLKNGWGTWPGDGIPNAPGSYPQAFWEMARKMGVEDRNGRAWKVSAWYSHSFGSAADLAFLQQVLMLPADKGGGPVHIGTPWPSVWFATPSAANGYRMPYPSGGMSGSHAYVIIGWETYGSDVWLTCMNSWGAWGSPQGIFRIKADWLYAPPLGPQIIHKVLDEDNVPDPPAPPPSGGDAMKSYDAVPRTLDVRMGAQFYEADGTTPLVKLTSGGNDLYSPCKWDAGNYQVRISTGGVTQIAVVRAADCSDIRPYAADCSAAVAAEHKRWDDWLLTAPK